MATNYVHNPLEGDKPELIIDLEQAVGDLVSIIVVHKDRPAYLNLCLQSLAICSQNASHEIIVVDNNSGPETQEFLIDIQKDVKVVRNTKNIFWSDAVTAGIRHADPRSKYYIIMHSDVVILNPSWIDLFVNVASSNNSGMVGLETGSYVVGKQKVDFVQEWCLLISKECYQKIGPWPSELPMIGHSFIMTIKAQINGFRPQVMKNILAHHFKIFGIDINDYEQMTERAAKIIPKIYQQVQVTQL